MATISDKSWTKYIVRLRNLSNKAADDLIKFINNGHDIYNDPSMDKVVIDYAYGLATKYGEGAGALASEMYDALAELSGKTVPPAVPAPTAKYGEVAKAVYGTKLQSDKPEVMGGAVGRLVKMAGVDTMQQNALRDGAEWAWIPRGDTCAFCLTLASRGWQRASKKAIKNGHAEHIHANCDCTYAIRFSDDVTVEGYDPEALKAMYDEAEGATPNDKINYMRRQFYAENKGIVGDESSIAEEYIPTVSRPKTSNTINFAQEPLDEYEMMNISEEWFNNLTPKEQGMAAYFDTYNFTRDAGKEAETEILEKAISKYRLPAPIKTYRGVSEDEFFELMFDYGSEGLKTTEIKGSSLSEDRAIAFAKPRGGWLIEYDIKKGHNGAYFDGGVPGSNEKQFVINRNVDYKVVSVDRKGKKIVVEIG